MSHITIIISKAAAPDSLEAGYEYRIPVPHDATSTRVGEIVRKAYRHLEGHIVTPQDEQGEE